MSPKKSAVLITGAGGVVGTFLRTRLPDHELTLLDVVPVSAEGVAGSITASVTDLKAMTAACHGFDAVIHLGGLSTENTWANILDVNINGTYVVLEAARRAGVKRVILASSNHAVGYHENAEEPLPDALVPLPDTYYGVSKVALEGLGALYHHRYGLEVICLRIGSCFEKPRDERMLSTWLSPDDCGRLMDACLTAPDPGYVVGWAVSANTRRRWSLDAVRSLGFDPQDDAEVHAAGIAPETNPDVLRLVGGGFCSHDLDAPIPVGIA